MERRAGLGRVDAPHASFLDGRNLLFAEDLSMPEGVSPSLSDLHPSAVGLERVDGRGHRALPPGMPQDCSGGSRWRRRIFPTSELLSLSTDSLVPPAPETGSSWSLLLHPSSMGAKSKIGESNETIILNSRRLAFIISALRVMYEAGKSAQPLWPCDYATFYRLLTETGRPLGISLVPYSMRHSGVTIDRASRARSQEEAQRRGRWKQATSMRRNEKGGRLGDSWRQLRRDVQDHCQMMKARGSSGLEESAMAPSVVGHRFRSRFCGPHARVAGLAATEFEIRHEIQGDC